VFTPAWEVPEAALAPANPMDEARRLWSGFLAGAMVQPRHRLRQIAAGDDMLNMDVRDCFELCAVQHCASEICGDDLRLSIAEHFDWDRDAAFAMRELPAQMFEVFARLRATTAYQKMLGGAEHDPAIKALLSLKLGKTRALSMDAAFMKSMRHLQRSIRSDHPELLTYKLDRTVFEFWEQQTASKRYYTQTALYSAALGLGFFIAGALAAARFDVSMNPFVGLLLAEALGFAVLGAFALYGPAMPAATLRHRWDALTGELIHSHRYRPAVQFGWLAPYALLSLALFIPGLPLPALALIALLIAICLLVASFANSVALGIWSYLIAAVAGVMFATYSFPARLVSLEGLVYAMTAMTAVQLLFRGGADLLASLAMPVQRFLPARLAWLAGATGLIASAHLLPLSPPLYAAILWIWALAGMLLSRPSIHMYFGYLGALAIRFAADSLPQPSLLSQPPASGLGLLLMAIAIFMVVNMKRQHEHQHPYL
ncbi:MAG: hypothetical protein ABIT83_10695, partial [Massilia sp.]